VLLANVSLWRGEPGKTLEYSKESRAVFQELNDPWGELQSMGPAALGLNAQLRSTEARTMVDDALEVAARVPDLAMNQLPNVLRVAVAIQNGDPDAYSMARSMVDAISREDTRFLSDEQFTLWGIAQLQHGDVAGATETLQATRASSTNRGSKAAADVALAAALTAGDRATEALEVCDEADELVVTFVDRYRLELARGFALHRTGDVEGGRTALDRAAAIVGATHSPLDQFVVRLARAALDHEAPADEQRSIGWETAFALMAGTPG
jgi:hypothetical protein